MFPSETVRERSFAFGCLKQTLMQPSGDETTGARSGNCHFHCNSEAIVSHWIGDTSYKHQSEHGTRSYGCISRGNASAPLSLCAFTNTVVESKQQPSGERTVKGPLPLEHSLHLEAEMGQSQRRPAEIPLAGAMPPSPRTVCALRLAEYPHRFCCHHQHFSYPERSMSYSPPYSPSLFKRPDRR